MQEDLFDGDVDQLSHWFRAIEIDLDMLTRREDLDAFHYGLIRHYCTCETMGPCSAVHHSFVELARQTQGPAHATQEIEGV